MLRDHIIGYIIRNMLEVKKDTFKLKEHFECENYVGDKVKAPLWSIEGQIGTDKFQALLCEVSDTEDLQEFIFLSKLEGSPTYASYLGRDEEDDITQSALSYSTQDGVWLPTNVYLQATYLAGMESLKDVLVEWHVNPNPTYLVSNLKSFYDSIMESEEDVDNFIPGDLL